jgi:lysophospholipase L1-like esterase
MRATFHAPGVQVVALVPAAGPVPEGPVMLHRYIGTNGQPLSKIRGFQEAIDSHVGQGVDVAAMKFCFWDIRADTDVRQVFAEYERTLAGLEARHPTTRFIHITVPLFAPDNDWRAGIRRLIGRPVPRTLDNAKRNELSDMIRARYAGREPVFDLARLEAAASTEGGVPYMAAELTTDGGHLNPEGRHRLATAFLTMVAGAAPAGPAGTH